MTCSVTGSINFECGQRIPYDDSNPHHKAVRLSRALPHPLVDCPVHGPERARTAVSGPAVLLWPDPAERWEILREIRQDDRDEDEWPIGDVESSPAPCQIFRRAA